MRGEEASRLRAAHQAGDDRPALDEALAPRALIFEAGRHEAAVDDDIAARGEPQGRQNMIAGLAARGVKHERFFIVFKLPLRPHVAVVVIVWTQAWPRLLRRQSLRPGPRPSFDLSDHMLFPREAMELPDPEQDEKRAAGEGEEGWPEKAGG